MRFCFTLVTIFAIVKCSGQQFEPQKNPHAPLHVPHPANAPVGCDEIEDEMELTRFKRQALQSVSVWGGYLGDLGGNELSSSFLDLSIGSGIPLGSFENILAVKPRFRADWIDARPEIDIPNQLYQFELQFFYRRPIHDRLSLMAIVSPSIRSDLTTSTRAFRMFALGLLNWECLDRRLTLSGGAVYLGRNDIPVLPAVGIVWTPNRVTKLDLRFPFSKLSRRLAKDERRSELWTYLSGGLGGNTWAVTRRSGLADELSLRDFRLACGIEKIIDGGGGWFAEVGYAMGRKLQYENDDSEIELNDAFLVQGGWRY